MELGENVVLSGFKEVDPSTMISVRRVVENHVQTLKGHFKEKFNKLRLTLKDVHKRETSQKYELHSHVIIDNKDFHSEHTDRNLLVGLDKVIKKVQAELEHKHGHK